MAKLNLLRYTHCRVRANMLAGGGIETCQGRVGEDVFGGAARGWEPRDRGHGGSSSRERINDDNGIRRGAQPLTWV